MFQIRDTEAGLSLSLSIDPEPRNPRLVEDNVFHVVSWAAGLGDPHDWPSFDAFHAAVTPDTAVIFPLYRVETGNGPILLMSCSDNDKIEGYAFAIHARLCLQFGLDEITPQILDDVTEEAEALCLGELQASEDFLNGDVYRFEIMNARGECIKKRRDLYGEDYARHIAQEVFAQYLYSAAMDG